MTEIELKEYLKHGLYCTKDGIGTPSMSIEELIAFIGYLDKKNTMLQNELDQRSCANKIPPSECIGS